MWQLYKDEKDNSVLVFRGTFSSGDFANIAMFLAGWFADRTIQGMRRTWEFFSRENGLWSKVEEERAGVYGILSRGALTLGTWLQARTFATTMHERFGSVSAETFSKLGYWPVQKALVDRLLDEDVPDMDKVKFSGQSQGGAIAALMSMYVAKSRGQKIDTVTFSAVGGACWARELGWPDQDGANYLDDIDPYRYHSHITDYADAYDVWGNMDVRRRFALCPVSCLHLWPSLPVSCSHRPTATASPPRAASSTATLLFPG